VNPENIATAADAANNTLRINASPRIQVDNIKVYVNLAGPGLENNGLEDEAVRMKSSGLDRGAVT
jgi:hypothetical protein